VPPTVEHLRPLPVRVGAGAAESSADESLRERPLHIAAAAASQDWRECESGCQRERAPRNPSQRHWRRRESHATDRDSRRRISQVKLQFKNLQKRVYIALCR